MTEKRFETTSPLMLSPKAIAWDEEKQLWLDIYNLEKELNALHEENKELKQQLDKTIDMLNKEINTSETAFDGILKEKQDYKDRVIKVLRNHYLECKKWNDTHTMLIIKQICGDLE